MIHSSRYVCLFVIHGNYVGIVQSDALRDHPIGGTTRARATR